MDEGAQDFSDPSGDMPGDAAPKEFRLRLYVAGTTLRSRRAVANVRKICEAHVCGRYALEVIDIYQQPGLAAAEKITATPMLIRQLPHSVRRLSGDLSDAQRVLRLLGLSPEATAGLPA